ncbi:MAG: DNA starvation/stationary phase protection protein [Xanthomonadales bacterium]|nr:DNA starvation/stationary phase protection protein [Gammaproteobacteria bacterium]NNE05154.1 DNA starvation/stationary phase protection protein [Xanthomonadales bacterium]NNL95176.1 DNA starvation/stationary phase protection protein [Xanthomonadales bacterium]
MNQQREQVISQLEKLLASSYTLYLKTHNYHWNVTGPMFTTLHGLFEEQYTDLALAVDEIAERIRALDARAPGSYSEFAKLSAINEDTGSPAATDMIGNLVSDQSVIADITRDLIEAAEAIPDAATADLATRRMDVHQKNAWMLRSHLE